MARGASLLAPLLLAVALAETAALDTKGARRVTLLREYRHEAAELVIDCAAEVKDL